MRVTGTSDTHAWYSSYTLSQRTLPDNTRYEHSGLQDLEIAVIKFKSWFAFAFQTGNLIFYMNHETYTYIAD